MNVTLHDDIFIWDSGVARWELSERPQRMILESGASVTVAPPSRS